MSDVCMDYRGCVVEGKHDELSCLYRKYGLKRQRAVLQPLLDIFLPCVFPLLPTFLNSDPIYITDIKYNKFYMLGLSCTRIISSLAMLLTS